MWCKQWGNLEQNLLQMECTAIFISLIRNKSIIKMPKFYNNNNNKNNCSISKYTYKLNKFILRVLIFTAVVYLSSEGVRNENLTDQRLIWWNSLYITFKCEYLLICFYCSKAVFIYVVKLAYFNSSTSVTKHIFPLLFCRA